MSGKNDKTKNAQAMPKWLLYGLVAKGIIITGVVIAVLWYAGILG